MSSESATGAPDGTLLALGLISGTSMDGIDAALIACDPGPDSRPTVLGWKTVPYGDAMMQGLRSLGDATPATLARMNAAVGEAFASAALELLDDLGVQAQEVAAVGSHGQTLVHLPAARDVAGFSVRTTLQIGEAAVIAARTGIVTVADFRAMDMALGGQGAPLVPLLDWRAFRHPSKGRVLLNLGGIGNLTALPPGSTRQQVVAFDTGPGNVLLDFFARERELPDGIDRGGEVALSGSADPDLLQRALQHEYYTQAPPKSADVTDFLGPMAELIQPAAADLSSADLLATLAELTAASVAEAIDRWVRPAQPVDEVLVSGGGLHNRAVMTALGRLLGPSSVSAATLGAEIPPDAKEAAAFALLALETLAGRPGNLPSVTGASAAAPLGKVVYPPRSTD